MSTNDQPRKILEACPNCGEGLEITQLNCTSCETEIRSRYAPCRFCTLSPESLHLIELFVQSRGNLKEMERELGVSYPTVRARLDAAIKELGFDVPPAELDAKAQRREVLARLEKGEINATEAANLLAEIGSAS